MENVKTIAITGASGFIGQHLVSELLKNTSFHLKILVRQNCLPEWLENKRINIVKGDLFNKNSISQLLEDTNIFIHLTYLPNATTEQHLLVMNSVIEEVNESQIENMLFLSTAILVGSRKEDEINEELIPNPKNDYEKVKYELEINLQKKLKKCKLAILRPTAVFGRNGKNLNKIIEDRIADGMIKRCLRSHLYQDRRLNLVSVERVVSAILFLIENMSEKNIQTYIVSNDDDINNNYFAVSKKIDETFELKSILIVPVHFFKCILKLLLKLAGNSNFNPNRNYSNKKLIELGWSYKKPFEQEIHQYLQWYKVSKNQ